MADPRFPFDTQAGAAKLFNMEGNAPLPPGTTMRPDGAIDFTNLVDEAVTRSAQVRGGAPAVQVAQGPGPSDQKITTTTRTKTSPISEEAMRTKLEDFTAANAQLNAVLQAATGQIQATGEQAASAVIDAGKAEAQATKAAGEIAATRQEGNQDIARFFHATLGPEDALAKAEASRVQAQGVMNALKPMIDQEDAIRIYDDPLRWLVNQLTLPQIKTQYNAAFKTQQQQEQFIQQTQANVERQKTLDLTISGQMMRDVAAATAQQQMTQALAKAAVTRNQTSHQVANIAMQQASLLNMNMQAYESFARVFMVSQGQTAAEGRLAKLQPTVDKINMQDKAMGLPGNMTVEEFDKLDARTRTMYERHANLPPGTFGENPGDAFLTMSQRGGLNTYIDVNRTASNMMGRYMHSPEFELYKQQQLAQNPHLARLAPEEQQAELLTSFNNQQLTDMQKRQFDKLPDSSPYKPQVGNAILYPDMASNPFTKTVQENIVATGGTKPVSYEAIEQRALGMAYAEPGKIPQIASDLSKFWQTLQTEQWNKGGGAAFGFRRPEQFGTTTMVVNGKPVNQWNPAEVENWLLAKVATQNRYKAMGVDINAQPAPLPNFLTNPFLQVPGATVNTEPSSVGKNPALGVLPPTN